MSISSLIAEKRKERLGSNTYLLLPYTLGLTAKLAGYYEAKGKSLSYIQEVFASGVVSEEFINVTIETLYLFIENPEISLNDFKKDILDNEKDISRLVMILLEIMDKSNPIYDLEDKKKVTKVQIILGWVIMILCLIGLIATTYLVVGIITHSGNFWSLLSDNCK